MCQTPYTQKATPKSSPLHVWIESEGTWDSKLAFSKLPPQRPRAAKKKGKENKSSRQRKNNYYHNDVRSTHPNPKQLAHSHKAEQFCFVRSTFLLPFVFFLCSPFPIRGYNEINELLPAQRESSGAPRGMKKASFMLHQRRWRWKERKKTGELDCCNVLSRVSMSI